MKAAQQLKEAIAQTGKSRKWWYRNVYLNSEHWRNLRNEAKAEHGNVCSCCGSFDRLRVHHLHYRSIFDVTVSDLQIMCEKCHEAEHRKKKEHRRKNRRVSEKRLRKQLEKEYDKMVHRNTAP